MTRTRGLVVALLRLGSAALIALGVRTDLFAFLGLGCTGLLVGLARLALTPRGWPGTLLKALAWGVAVVVTLVPLVAVGAWQYFRPEAPEAFYDAPADRPNRAGALVRREPFTRGVPPGRSRVEDPLHDDAPRRVAGRRERVGAGHGVRCLG